MLSVSTYRLAIGEIEFLQLHWTPSQGDDTLTTHIWALGHVQFLLRATKEGQEPTLFYILIDKFLL